MSRRSSAARLGAQTAAAQTTTGGVRTPRKRSASSAFPRGSRRLDHRPHPPRSTGHTLTPRPGLEDCGAMDVAAEYLRLGLRFDRLEEGFVDAFTGDPALRREVENEPPPQPRAMAAQARDLLAALPESGLPADRTAFLTGQLAGLELSARKFAGDDINFVEEVTTYFQVRPEPGEPERYARAHAELDALLPGDGTLLERYAAFRRRDQCPPEKLEPAVCALHSALRDLVRSGYGLPEQETVEFVVVTDKPWSGFNYYLGGYRSRVAVNSDLPQRLSHLPHLVAHESYPGHHTEHCRKERGLVLRDGHVEHQIFLVNTPECLMAEGLADLGIAASVGRHWGPWAAEIYADLGLPSDGELTERVQAALLGLDARPAGQPLADRFVRLLEEPLTPATVQAELA